MDDRNEQHASGSLTVTARSKLTPPALPPEATWSDGLVERLAERTASSRLTLLRADGGAGKTTLARALAEAAGGPWAWVTLDARDDLRTVAGTVLAALRGADPALADELGDVDVAADDPDVLGVVLANAVADADVDVVTLVVDDAHAPVTPTAAAFLAALVDAAPPSLHLVVTTRHDLPGLGGARAIALGDTVAVDADVLRVDADVAGRILRRLGWDGDEAEIRDLVNRTGGWVLGLRLLATAPTLVSDPEMLLTRYVEEEVLGTRSAADVEVLEQCSVLALLTPRGLAPFLPHADPRAWLAELRADLPLLTSSIGASAVRLHDLLRAVLADRIAADPERAAAAHRLAAAVAEDWSEQVDHLVAAGDHDAAGDVLDRVARRGHERRAVRRAITTRTSELPHRVLAARPWLRAVAALTRGTGQPRPEVHDELLEIADEVHGTDGMLEWLCLRNGTIYADGPEKVALLGRRQHALVRDGLATLDAGMLAEHHIALAHVVALSPWDGDGMTAADHHDEAIRIARASGSLEAVEAVSRSSSWWMVQQPGGVQRILQWCDWADEQAPSGEADVDLRAWLAPARAMAHLMAGDPDAALRTVLEDTTVVTRSGVTFSQLGRDWTAHGVWFARGDLVAAAAAADVSRPTPMAGVSKVAAAARVLSQQGDAAGLADLVAMVRSAPRPGGSVARTTELGLLVAKAELARVEGRPRDAVAMLRGAAAHLPAIVVPGVGDVHLDVVVALHDAGEADEAARLLADRVALHDRSGLPGVVVFRGAALLPVLDRLHDAGIALPQVRRALQLLRPDRPSALSTGDGQELSPREVEVLRLVAAGLSNREIAEQLVISVNTVKTHVRRLNAKLGVRSRTAAAARATRLGLR